MFLSNAKYAYGDDGKLVRKIYFDKSKNLEIRYLYDFRTCPIIEYPIYHREPHSKRPVKPVTGGLSPVPRKIYPDEALLKRYKANINNRKFDQALKRSMSQNARNDSPDIQPYSLTRLILPYLVPLVFVLLIVLKIGNVEAMGLSLLLFVLGLVIFFIKDQYTAFCGESGDGYDPKMRKNLKNYLVDKGKKYLNSVNARELGRKAKNTLYGIGLGATLTLAPLSKAISQNNYDNNPVKDKNKIEIVYEDKQEKVPVIDKEHKLTGDSVMYSQARDSLAYSNKYGAFYNLEATELARQELRENRDGFYGDQVLNSWKHPNVRNTDHSYDFTWDYYGSGDVDGDGDCDMDDYNSFPIGGTNDRADVNGDQQLTSADKQIIYNYITDQITHIPGAHYEVSTTSEQIDWVTKMIAIDSTDVYHPGWTCGNYSRQFGINFAGIEKISECGLNLNLYDTTQNGRFNLPVYEVGTMALNGEGHSINAIIVKDTATNFWHYKFIEPQNDAFVQPGDPSMHPDGWANLTRYTYLARGPPFNDTTHVTASIIDFDLNNGVPSVDWVNSDIVEFRPWISTHPYAELPSNYGSECSLETDPDITGWPENESSDVTEMLYSDSTNTTQDTLWRKWKIIGQHPVIDSTLGKQIIYTLPDTTAPALDWAPQNPLIVNLGEPTSSDITGIPTYTDNCDESVITDQYTDSVYYFGNFSNPQNCDDLQYDIFRPFDATDSAGNTSEEFLHQIKVRDIESPYISTPSNINIQWTPDWIGDIHPDNTGYASATDNGIIDTIYYTDDYSAKGDNPAFCNYYSFTIPRTWIAKDVCNNISNDNQYINIVENIAPNVQAPNDTTINSTSSTSTSVLGEPYVTDNTGYFTTDYSDSDNQDPDPSHQGYYNYILERTHQAFDPCGNSGTDLQTIIVQDTTAPNFTDFVEDIQNNEWGYELNIQTPQAQDDNLEAPVDVSLTSIDTIYGNSDPLSCAYINDAVIKYHWKAIDPSGNFISKVQNYHMQDTEAPQNMVTPNLMNYLYGEPLVPFENPSATDNSGIVNYFWNVGETNQNPNELICEHYDYDGEFNWNVSDRCNNSVSVNSPFNVDKGLTTFYEFFPSNMTVPEGDTAISITGEPIGKDALNQNLAVNYSYYDELLSQNLLERNWARHFSLSDVCNQTANDSIQYITEDLDVSIEPSPTNLPKCINDVLSPNPTNEKVNINLQGQGPFTLTTFNMLGQKIDQKNIQTPNYEYKFNKELPQGMYFLKVESNNPKCLNLEKIVIIK